MDHLRAMKVFVRVIDEGGFARAARALDMAPPGVTRAVAELEAHLGARLLNRTTRRIALTEIGESYLERARQILADVEDAEALARESAREPRGVLRVLAPPAVAVHQLAKHLPRLRALYPQLTLDLSAPGAVETVGDEFDVTIIVTREPLDGDFVARRLARSEVIMCAAPEYLDRHGRPEHPDQLQRHVTLVPPLSSLSRGMTFQRVGAAAPRGAGGPPDASVVVVPQLAGTALRTTHVDTNYAAALAGLGITGLASFVAEDALMENALERVLPDWRLFSLSIWAAVSSRKHLPARTQAFLDFLVQIFGGEDRDPWLAAIAERTACRDALRPPASDPDGTPPGKPDRSVTGKTPPLRG